MRKHILSAFVLVSFAAGPVAAQNFAGLNAAAAAGTLDFRRAKVSMPQLSQVIFEKADANGDGIVSPTELPTLEAIYRTLYMDR